MRASATFPVSERAVIEWESIFTHAASIANYVGYLRKDRNYLERPLSWETSDVAHVIAPIRMEGKGEYRFPKFARRDIVAIVKAQDPRNILTRCARTSSLFIRRGSLPKLYRSAKIARTMTSPGLHICRKLPITAYTRINRGVSRWCVLREGGTYPMADPVKSAVPRAYNLQS